MYKIISYSYIIFITFILLIPVDSEVVINIVEKDNHPSDFISLFIHFILMFILYYLFKKTYSNYKYLLIFIIMYSILIEYFQIFTTRGFEFFDLIFNLFGVISGYLYFLIFKKNEKW